MAKQKNVDKPEATPKLLDGRIMLRVREYATLTGTPLPTAYKYVNSGAIPVIRIGGSLRIPVAAVLKQLKAAEVVV
jgi:excisionase family DNA binding protein